jgi:carbon starvation protein CstA
MNAMPLLIIALAIFALAYRYYYAFIATKVVVVNDLLKHPHTNTTTERTSIR